MPYFWLLLYPILRPVHVAAVLKGGSGTAQGQSKEARGSHSSSKTDPQVTHIIVCHFENSCLGSMYLSGEGTVGAWIWLT